MNIAQTFQAVISFTHHCGRGCMHEATEDYWFIADTFYQRNRMVSLTVEQAFEKINRHVEVLGLQNLGSKPIVYALLNLRSDIIHGRRR